MDTLYLFVWFLSRLFLNTKQILTKLPQRKETESLNIQTGAHDLIPDNKAVGFLTQRLLLQAAAITWEPETFQAQFLDVSVFPFAALTLVSLRPFFVSSRNVLPREERCVTRKTRRWRLLCPVIVADYEAVTIEMKPLRRYFHKMLLIFQYCRRINCHRSLKIQVSN